MTDPELGDKRKRSEKFENSRKKRNSNKKTNIVDLTNDDYNLISDRMEEVTNKICKKMVEFHTELVSIITDLL